MSLQVLLHMTGLSQAGARSRVRTPHCQPQYRMTTGGD